MGGLAGRPVRGGEGWGGLFWFIGHDPRVQNPMLQAGEKSAHKHEHGRKKKKASNDDDSSCKDGRKEKERGGERLEPPGEMSAPKLRKYDVRTEKFGQKPGISDTARYCTGMHCSMASIYEPFTSSTNAWGITTTTIIVFVVADDGRATRDWKYIQVNRSMYSGVQWG